MFFFLSPTFGEWEKLAVRRKSFFDGTVISISGIGQIRVREGKGKVDLHDNFSSSLFFIQKSFRPCDKASLVLRAGEINKSTLPSALAGDARGVFICISICLNSVSRFIPSSVKNSSGPLAKAFSRSSQPYQICELVQYPYRVVG